MAVAVVSWNTRELLLRCLDSLAGDVAEGRAEVWVVDNGSTDGSQDAARERAPWATVLASPANLGFGAAVNLVARGTGSPWVMAANADIELLPGALTNLLEAGGVPAVGCVAPLLELPDGRAQHSIHSLPTIGFTLALNGGLHALDGRVADRMLLEGRYDAARPRHVPWAYGACLLIRRAAFEAVGGFDEQQWMYAEDLDLCWRLNDGGWRVVYEPAARVRHLGGAATAQAFGTGPARVERFMTATYRAIARRRGMAYAIAVGTINVLGAGARIVWMTPLANVSSRWRAARDANSMWLRAHLRAVLAATRGRGSRDDAPLGGLAR